MKAGTCYKEMNTDPVIKILSIDNTCDKELIKAMILEVTRHQPATLLVVISEPATRCHPGQGHPSEEGGVCLPQTLAS